MPACGGGVLADFRQSIAGRLCRLLSPGHIILAGGRDPALADMLLAEAAAAGATLHIATPVRQEWHLALRRRAGDTCVLHIAAPAEAISLLAVPELCWIDADPNWFTTQSILAALEAKATRLARPFPVTLIENTGWPYGRRDSYDDPAAIPAAHRHPHEHAGLLPGQAALAGGEGLQADRYNAAGENEPGQGVLTAVEDFLTDRVDALRFVALPGFGGRMALSPRHGPGALAFAPEGLAADALCIATALEATRLEQAVELRARAAAVQRAESLAAALRSAPPPRLRTQIAALPVVRDSLRPAVRQARQLLRQIQAGRMQAGGMASGAEADDAADIARLRASPAFDAAWYLQTYTDVAAAGLDPAAHYLRGGAAEGRDPGPFFSSRYYLDTYPDVAEAGLNPLLHYLASGAAEGRAPAPDFDAARYRGQHSDLAGLTPLEHFAAHGGR